VPERLTIWVTTGLASVPNPPEAVLSQFVPLKWPGSVSEKDRALPEMTPPVLVIEMSVGLVAASDRLPPCRLMVPSWIAS